MLALCSRIGGKNADVELEPLPTMDALVFYLQGRPSFLFDQTPQLLFDEHDPSNTFQASTDISSICGHIEAKRTIFLVIRSTGMRDK